MAAKVLSLTPRHNRVYSQDIIRKNMQKSQIPVIASLSCNKSPAGSSSEVIIIGLYFDRNSQLFFGKYKPIFDFVSSTQIHFYVPTHCKPGKYPIQIFNSNSQIPSNILTYTIESAEGYWLLDGVSQSITNTNQGGIYINPPIYGLPFFVGFVKIRDNQISSISKPLSFFDEDKHYIDTRNPVAQDELIFSYMGTYLVHLHIKIDENDTNDEFEIILKSICNYDDQHINIVYSETNQWNNRIFKATFYLHILQPSSSISLLIQHNCSSVAEIIDTKLNTIIVHQIG